MHLAVKSQLESSISKSAQICGRDATPALTQTLTKALGKASPSDHHHAPSSAAPAASYSLNRIFKHTVAIMSSFGGPGGGQKVFKPTPYVFPAAIMPTPSPTPPHTTPTPPLRVDRILFRHNCCLKANIGDLQLTSLPFIDQNADPSHWITTVRPSLYLPATTHLPCHFPQNHLYTSCETSPLPRTAADTTHYLGECKTLMTSYLRCLRSHRGMNDPECRGLSKSYLQCRMERYVSMPPLYRSRCF
jgi:hypothetical protein